MLHRQSCANCGYGLVTQEVIDDSFPYGLEPETVMIPYKATLYSCPKCKMQFMDEEAEDARREALILHLQREVARLKAELAK